MFHRQMETLLGNGIFNADGDEWRHQRKTASFEFASRVLRDYSTVIFRENALKLADILARVSDTKKPIDMQVTEIPSAGRLSEISYSGPQVFTFSGFI